MIRKARKEDLFAVKGIAEACTKDLDNQGIFQWNSTYPSLAIFEKDILEEALYVYEIQGEIQGCIMFSEEKDPLYDTIEWMCPDFRNLYIHRLAVHPQFQKKGIARQLMNFAESFAIHNKMHSIRLDTFSQNPRNIRFYELIGYHIRGDVIFNHQSEYPFHCFEKLIKRI